jgi:hypothetical protein
MKSVRALNKLSWTLVLVALFMYTQLLDCQPAGGQNLPPGQVERRGEVVMSDASKPADPGACQVSVKVEQSGVWTSASPALPVRIVVTNPCPSMVSVPVDLVMSYYIHALTSTFNSGSRWHGPRTERREVSPGGAETFTWDLKPRLGDRLLEPGPYLLHLSVLAGAATVAVPPVQVVVSSDGR